MRVIFFLTAQWNGKQLEKHVLEGFQVKSTGKEINKISFLSIYDCDPKCNQLHLSVTVCLCV